jgi:flagellar motor switch protein FliM
MEINPNLGFAFLDKLLGGPGSIPEKVRGLTEIEQTVIERLGQRMLDFLREPWESIIDLEPAMERVETNPQFTQLVSPSEVMMIVSLETKMADVLGMINICIPFLVLEPIISKLSVHYYYSTSAKRTTPENSVAIQSKIETAYVPVKVLLGRTCITVKDLLQLSLGDVIPLDKNFQDDLEVLVGQPYTDELKKAEAIRCVKEALLINPYITDVTNITVLFTEGLLSIECNIITVYGEVSLDV